MLLVLALYAWTLTLERGEGQLPRSLALTAVVVVVGEVVAGGLEREEMVRDL